MKDITTEDGNAREKLQNNSKMFWCKERGIPRLEEKPQKVQNSSPGRRSFE
jgi:hypothetical protein